MASSKLYNHFFSSLFILQKSKNSIKITKKITNISSPILLKSFYCSSSAVLSSEINDVDTSSSSSSVTHAWPEWDQFVEKIKKKGYFAKEGEEASSYKMEQNIIKNACFKFARERYDIISSLPKEDMKTVVEYGCPNTFRKYVNSAKRLRAFLKVDERDVCGACNLRESCGRANVIEKDDDNARTVDIVRILLIYALNNSDETNQSIAVHVQESARKLLGELIKLSDTTIDPTFPVPEVRLQSKKELTEKSKKVISKTKRLQSGEMKKGDWICPKCEFVNFARNMHCRECDADAPKRVDKTPEMKMGDWICPKCEFLNFSRNALCRECKADAPKRVDKASEMKMGDWTCPKCEFMNFSRNKKCHRCHDSRPKRELNPGEWECPKCDFLNFRKNTVCKKCDCKRPAYAKSNEFDDHVWKNPRMAKENKALNFGDDEDEEEDAYDDDDELDDIFSRQDGRNIFAGSKKESH